MHLLSSVLRDDSLIKKKLPRVGLRKRLWVEHDPGNLCETVCALGKAVGRPWGLVKAGNRGCSKICCVQWQVVVCGGRAGRLLYWQPHWGGADIKTELTHRVKNSSGGSDVEKWNGDGTQGRSNAYQKLVSTSSYFSLEILGRTQHLPATRAPFVLIVLKVGIL